MSVCRNAPSMFIYDNSYVKCRELTLSYHVPKSWLKNVVSGPVSYTHLSTILDHFEQVLHLGQLIQEDVILNKLCLDSDGTWWMGAVSYTHLDVYKRQG